MAKNRKPSGGCSHNRCQRGDTGPRPSAFTSAQLWNWMGALCERLERICEALERITVIAPYVPGSPAPTQPGIFVMYGVRSTGSGDAPPTEFTVTDSTTTTTWNSIEGVPGKKGKNRPG